VVIDVFRAFTTAAIAFAKAAFADRDGPRGGGGVGASIGQIYFAPESATGHSMAKDG
jgi:hypothetical protein